MLLLRQGIQAVAPRSLTADIHDHDDRLEAAFVDLCQGVGFLLLWIILIGAEPRDLPIGLAATAAAVCASEMLWPPGGKTSPVGVLRLRTAHASGVLRPGGSARPAVKASTSINNAPNGMPGQATPKSA